MPSYALSEATATKLKEVLGSYRPGSSPQMTPSSSGLHIAIIPCLEKAGDTPEDNWPYYDAGIAKWIDSRPKVNETGLSKHFLIGIGGQPLSTGADYLAVAGPEVTLYHAGQMRTRSLWIAIPNALDALSRMIAFTRTVAGGATHIEAGVLFKEGRTLKWNHDTMSLVDDQECWVKEIT
jgi:hypothetical protein